VEAVCDRVGILYDGELVAVDTVDGLRRAVGATAELRLRVADDAPIDVDVTAVPGVESVEEAGGVVRVACSKSRAKADVVARLARAGVDVLDVDSREPSLEDVFTAYTNGGDAAGDTGAAERREVVA
jgi:ABC-2 type transport system ATP-binding protein